MTPQQFKRVEDLFAAALELPSAERPHFLASSCDGDDAVRRRVLALLAQEVGTLHFVADAVAHGAAEVASTGRNPWIGRRAGPWRITGTLGEGGMGAVFEVVRDDGAYDMRAAMKLVRAERDTAESRRRFLEERRILAQLEHPNIARLIDGGETSDGQPFLVMEAVVGQPITDYCDERRLGIRDRVRLFVSVCRAVQAAHQKLIVHRDLKPSNIFVTAAGVPKLLDFGIAKLLDEGLDRERTATGMHLLTPDFASPEQVRGDGVTAASDVYSLGAILYLLLTGAKAHQFNTYSVTEVLAAVCERETTRPSDRAPDSIRRSLEGDLDWIVLTALRKEPHRRYGSAEAFARDLENYLDARPVIARPDSLRYRALKFVTRNKLAVGAALVVALSMVAGTAMALHQARRAERRFAQVRNLANTFLFDFHDQIQNLPGSTAAREMVVKTALGYLDSLAAESADDPSLQLELAAAYEKVGDVQGDPSRPNLGRIGDSFQSYRRALDLRHKALGPTPATADAARPLIDSYLRLTDTTARLGNTSESHRWLSLARPLVQRYGTTQQQMDASRREGDLALRSGQGEPAVQHYMQSRRAAETLVARTATARHRRLLADSLIRIVNASKMTNDSARTLAVVDEGVAMYEALLKEDPNNVLYKQNLIRLHNDAGDTLRSPFRKEPMRPDLSLVRYQTALRLAEELYAADPHNMKALFDVGFEKLQVADTYRELKRPESLPLLDQGEAHWDIVYRGDPGNVDGQRYRAMLHLVRGLIHRDQGNLRASSDALDRSYALAERVSASPRVWAQLWRVRIDILGERALTRIAMRRFADAEADLAACRAQSAQKPIDGLRRIDLRETGDCFDFSGDLALLTRRFADAAAHYQQALLRWDAAIPGAEGPLFAARRRQTAARLAEARAAMKQNGM